LESRALEAAAGLEPDGRALDYELLLDCWDLSDGLCKGCGI
jgi:hypothetical protein